MAKMILMRAIGLFAAVCLVLPILNIKTAADYDYVFDVDPLHISTILSAEEYTGETFYLSGVYTEPNLQLYIYYDNMGVVWDGIEAENTAVELCATGIPTTPESVHDGLNFAMSSGSIESLRVVNSFYFGDNCTIEINGNARIMGNVTIIEDGWDVDIATDSIIIGGNAYIGGNLIINSGAPHVSIEDHAVIAGEILGDPSGYTDTSTPPPDPEPDPVTPPPTTPDPPPSKPSYSSSSSSSSSSQPVKPVVGDVVEVETAPVLTSETAPPEYVPPKVVITDDTPVVIDGEEYAGTVKIDSVDSDKPQEIPKEVIINGESYAVGETVYIVGVDEKKVEANADTGFSYVFTAVENSDKPVKFAAKGLPDGLEISEDGVITTKTLPAPVGTFTIEITADNGAVTHTYEMTIEIKEGGLTDEELLAALTANDNPDLLTEPQEDVHQMWVNEELSVHYEPDIDDFYALFLDGQLLTPEEDYRLEEGSTVIILTEQTIAPLPNGDHVVTTMFHENNEVGLDTVINDVGSSSFVFRFGDENKNAKRVNISGDGVTGSVSFDDKNTEEQPLTTLSANTEEIETRAENLANATGNEIIAAFETKQQGGFGGKTATFAVSAKSLNLSLKNGTAVYVAVYDSKSGKTYQNKGEIKDGMIVFQTKHSGVFMIALKKF
jgi:hypothetical protein